jgi:hypothetical protein
LVVALVAAIAATVLVLSGAVAFGQSQEPLDPMGADYWTGTWTGSEDGAEYEGVETLRDGYKDISGLVYPGEVAADDPRMVGTWIQEEHLYLAESREPGEGEVGIASGTARIDNDAGAWVGTYTHWRIHGCDPTCIGGEWYVMDGEGAYEGLKTVFHYSHEDGFEGVILRSDLPALPEPVAPPAE